MSPQNGPSDSKIVPLRADHVTDVCRLEARAFNVLRNRWGQPEQSPRREDWMTYQVTKFPENGFAALSGNRLIGYSHCQVWGSLGWFGPVAVDPDCQQQGLGHALIIKTLAHLQATGCQTIGLETWPHSLKNVALYTRLGYFPGPLVTVFEKAITGAGGSFQLRRFSECENRDVVLEEIAAVSSQIADGLDYGPLISTIADLVLGETYLWDRDGDIAAVAVTRTESYSTAPAPEHLNVEVLFAMPQEASMLDEFLDGLEATAAQAGKNALRISLSSEHQNGLQTLLGRGYRLCKTRLRMLVKSQPISPHLINYLSYSD